MPRYAQCPQIMNMKFEDTDTFSQFTFLEVAEYPHLSKLKALTLPNPNHNLNTAPAPGSERPGNAALPANQKRIIPSKLVILCSCFISRSLQSPALISAAVSLFFLLHGLTPAESRKQHQVSTQILGHSPACDMEHF